MIRKTIPAQAQTITWLHEGVVDWSNAGHYYTPDGEMRELGLYTYSGVDFNAAISSADGIYTLIYSRLGTKGLLLKQGEKLREINRSYYLADTYAYPAAFFEFEGRTYLAHCPESYGRLDFEEVETGEIPTNIPGREPGGIFHSRLAVSPNHTFLLSTGWVWHPIEFAHAFDIPACFQNPLLLDVSPFQAVLRPGIRTEISSGSFLNDDTVLLASTSEAPELDDDEEPELRLPPLHAAFWHLPTGNITPPVKLEDNCGNLVVIDEHYAWDLHLHPKLFNLRTGTIEQQWPDILLGPQASSIEPDATVQIVVSPDRRTVAIRLSDHIEFLSL